MFEPRLTLVPEPDGEFSVLSHTRVPNGCYSAGRVSKKAPMGVSLGGDVVPLCLVLKFKARHELGSPAILTHRVFNLRARDGQTVRAFVMLGDHVLGSSDALVDTDLQTGAVAMVHITGTDAQTTRPPLTPALCQAVVVAATPKPGAFTGPSQQLHELGVADEFRAQIHRAGIRDRMGNLGYVIRPSDIDSGPAVTIQRCRDSVFNNAHE